MKKKYIAYLFLVVCILIVGYFFYDTYKIATGGKDSTEADVKSDPEKEGEVKIYYEDYGIDENLTYAVYTNVDKPVFYLFDSQVGCDEQALSSSNPNLFATVTLSSLEPSALVTGTVLYSRSIEGNLLEISGVPLELNSVQISKSDDKIDIDMELVWDNLRSIKGKITANACEIGATGQ